MNKKINLLKHLYLTTAILLVLFCITFVLINIYAHYSNFEKESTILEFKSSIPKNDQLVKTIIGFCNQNGGRLIIGVNNDGKITAIPETFLE